MALDVTSTDVISQDWFDAVREAHRELNVQQNPSAGAVNHLIVGVDGVPKFLQLEAGDIMAWDAPTKTYVKVSTPPADGTIYYLRFTNAANVHWSEAPETETPVSPVFVQNLIRTLPFKPRDERGL